MEDPEKLGLDFEKRRLDLEEKRFELDEKRFELDAESRRREVSIKEAELSHKRLMDERSDQWLFKPTTVTIIAGFLSLAAACLTAFVGGFWTLEVQKDKNNAEAALKEKERRFQIVIKATENRSQTEAAENLKFFVDIGYLPDPEERIAKKVQEGKVPVITSSGGRTENPLIDRRARLSPGGIAPAQRQGSQSGYKVKDHLLWDSAGGPVSDVAAHSVSSTKLIPKVIVIHGTAGPSGKATARWMENPDSRVSAHLLIDRDGTVTQLVPFDYVAHHAGLSKWQGLPVNNCSIAIELVNWGQLRKMGDEWRSWGQQVIPKDQVVVPSSSTDKSVGWHSFSEIQILSLVEVIKALHQEYPSIVEVVSHSDVGNNRTDPGPAFPLSEVRKKTLDSKKVN